MKKVVLVVALVAAAITFGLAANARAAVPGFAPGYKPNTHYAWKTSERFAFISADQRRYGDAEDGYFHAQCMQEAAANVFPSYKAFRARQNDNWLKSPKARHCAAVFGNEG